MFGTVIGEKPYTQGEIQTVQYGAFVGQVNLAHQPPTVSRIFCFLVVYVFFSLVE